MYMYVDSIYKKILIFHFVLFLSRYGILVVNDSIVTQFV